MLNQDLLHQTLCRQLQTTITSLSIKKLTGDASDRVYYRLSWQEDDLIRSYILMAMTGAAGAITSEEVTGKSSASMTELPFLNIQRHLLACKIAVPEISFYDEKQGWLLLEDLGDTTFADEVKKHLNTPARLLDFYKNAIDLLISLQNNATPISQQETIAHIRNYDQVLFEWEFDHFIEYGIEKRKGIRLSASKKNTLQSYFSKFSAHFADLPKFFTHRDYHSRNLMLQSGPTGEKIWLIDFQDALMGPCEYDLASLLRDSYIDLPDEIIENLIAYYIQSWKERAGRSIDPNLFRESFDLISIQRNMKAAGRFVFIDQVKHKNHLLPYVTPTLLKIRKTLEKYEHLDPLRALLAEDVPELQ